MDRRDVLLLMMAPAGLDSHTPVQVQKLAFLIEKTIGDKIDGTGFDFIPWHYGPFDKHVYVTLEELESEGLVAIEEGASGCGSSASLLKGLKPGRRSVMSWILGWVTTSRPCRHGSTGNRLRPSSTRSTNGSRRCE